jgi:hypothetical protein
MRYPIVLAGLLVLLAALAAPAQDKGTPRYGFDHVPNVYAQKTPKEAVASVVKAIDANRIDYLLAQLADPKYVDRQVADYKAFFPSAKDEARTFLAFDKLVSETAAYFQSDPVLIRELRLFAREGTWDVNEDIATGSVKEVPARKVFLRRMGERWYMENRQQ